MNNTCPNGHGALTAVETHGKVVFSCSKCPYELVSVVKEKRYKFPEKVKKAVEEACSRITMELFENRLTEGYVPAWKNQRWHKVLKCNYDSLRPYNGWNRVFLYWEDDDMFLTQSSIEKHGFKKPDAMPSVVIGWFPVFGKKTLDESQEDYLERKKNPHSFAMRTFFVYKAKDVEGMPEKPRPEDKEHKKDENVEAFVTRLKAQGLVIHEGGNNAHYSKEKDAVTMPKLSRFENTDLYYTSLFHEIAHWTGSESRLKRFSTEQEREKAYGLEELVAETAAASLCYTFGINVYADNALYIDSWLGTLKAEPTILAEAAQKAEKVLEFLFK